MQKNLEQSKQIQNEIDYYKAQKLLKVLLEMELISLLEFDKITMLNREKFSPKRADIMPINLDNIKV